jgi:hypothetical protein
MNDMSEATWLTTKDKSGEQPRSYLKNRYSLSQSEQQKSRSNGSTPASENPLSTKFYGFVGRRLSRLLLG